jgi:hypothetical protein
MWRVSSTAALAVAVAGAAGLGPAAPALAAPGDASARGVVFDLNASVLDSPVITANATFGTATAPPGGGTDTGTPVAFTLPPGPPATVGVGATGTVVQVSATRGPNASSASASVANVALTILLNTADPPAPLQVLAADTATAAVNCPRVGAQTADTTLTGLELFGTPVTLAPNTPGVTQSADVTALGLTNASLTVTLTSVESTTATGARAVALLATVTLSGISQEIGVTIPAGTVILAEAICERPAAAPTTSPTVRPILPVTGSGSDANGILLAIGAALIIAGAVARVTFRRRRSERVSTTS